MAWRRAPIAPLLVLLAAAPASAEDAPADTLPLAVEAAKADKKLLVAQNLGLTESEASGFWPVYDAYQRELEALDDRLAALIERYAKEYRAGTLTDPTAQELIEENLAVDEAEVAMRKEYLAKLTGVLPAKKAARYLQIENKLRAMLRHQLAGKVPLVE
jgi:hypothetical protein